MASIPRFPHYSGFDRIVDLLTHGGEACVDVVIGEAKHFQTVFLQYGRALGVTGLSQGFIVLGAVDLDHQLCRVAVKIGDKGVDDPLLIEFDRICVIITQSDQQDQRIKT